jgi:hypothetical protein
MSNTGLHAGFYDEIRAFGELVDAVITDLSVGSDSDANRRELAEKLAAMSEPACEVLLLRYLGPGSTAERKRIGDLAKALKEQPDADWVSQHLENLARLLDGGRSLAVARLHGDAG